MQKRDDEREPRLRETILVPDVTNSHVEAVSPDNRPRTTVSLSDTIQRSC